MMIFDFFKKFFGWADQRSRKRRASSSSLFEDCDQVKRHRCDDTISHHQQTLLAESRLSDDDNDDDDDIEILSEEIFRPALTGQSPNEARSDKIMSSTFSNSSTFLSTFSTQQKVKRNASNIGNSSGRNNEHSNNSTRNSFSTLVKTHRLREKKQYGEMLQNFMPRRIPIMNPKIDDSRTTQPEMEVITLDKYDASGSSRLGTRVGRLPFLSSLQMDVHNNLRKHEYPLNGNSRHFICSKASAQKNNKASEVARDKTESSTVQQSDFPKSTATNSLKDKLAARAVMKGDFILQVTERYNARIEQRYKEAEELRKITRLYSEHNRLARQAGLEEQLAQSMRLCETVLDEREEEEESALPVLSPNMLETIKNALVPRPANQVLVENFGLRITRKDIHTLSGLNWLNDEVINFYMNLLIVRGTTENFPKVHAMNTFFYPKLLSGGHASLKRWTRKVDIFSQDLLIVPVHLGIHWCMSIVDFRNKSISYYDSMGGKNHNCLLALKQYLQDESLDKKKQPYDLTDWKLECVKNIPQQMNGSDCGVFSCMFAEYVSGNKNITFSQEDMPYFRNKMVYEILHSELL